MDSYPGLPAQLWGMSPYPSHPDGTSAIHRSLSEASGQAAAQPHPKSPSMGERSRPTRWIWLTLALLLVHPAPPSTRPRGDPGRVTRAATSNILIIVGDDHAGGTLGIDGDPRRATPRLDALARQGARFDRAYCNSPLCTPSRQSILTGRLPHAIGVTTLRGVLPADAVTLGDWAGDLGYATGAIGKMHFNSAASHGFTTRFDTLDWERDLARRFPPEVDRRRRWRPLRSPAREWLNADCLPVDLPEPAMEAAYLADKAVDYLATHKAERFALVVGFHQPHAPFEFPKSLAGHYKPEEFAAPPVSAADRDGQPRIFEPLTPADARGIIAAYYSSLAYIDTQVGRILDALDALDLSRSTVVVYLSDNGYMLGQHGRFEKHTMYEPAVRVPLIVRSTGRVPPGRRVVELVELVDVLPTVLNLAGLPTPTGLHGRSLTPLIEGVAGAKGREVVVSEYVENEEAMARSSRYKLICGSGRSPRKDGYVERRPPSGPYRRLHDLMTDPKEDVDLIDRPELAGLVAELEHAMFLRLSTTRGDREPVPDGLTEAEAIRWCLVPRDGP